MRERRGHYNGLTARSDQRVLCFLQLDVPQRGCCSRCAAGCLIKVLMHQLVHNLVGPCCLHRLRLLQDLLHYTGFFYGSLESQSALRGSARAAQVSSSRGDTHRLSWIGPSHSQACAPKGSVDLPIFESDLQVGNWLVASFSRTSVRSRNLVDAHH